MEDQTGQRYGEGRWRGGTTVKYGLVGFGICLGISTYLAIGLLLLAVAPFDLFDEIADTEDQAAYWVALIMWPFLLILSIVLWIIERIESALD